MNGPQTEFSQILHAQKYRSEGESFDEAMSRIAGALTRGRPSEDYHKLRNLLLGMRFMPAGRVQSAMGSTKRVCAHNCFVSGTINDSFVDGSGSIMHRATEAATTMRMGGGIGYDFSTLRPRGDVIRKLGSQSSGPVSFMRIFDAICRCVASSGHRRGAQMAVMRIDHPDIEEFIRAKQNTTELTGFNVSVAVTDEFMECLIEKKPFMLQFDGKPHREVDPEALWDTVMRSTWDWAEPGVLFIDTINRMNNLHYCETIRATNPCGEQPLPPHGACLLGSFNLVKYLRWTDDDVLPGYSFDFEQLKQDVPVAVEAMDRVIDEAIYPLPEQEQEAKRKRRMGLGVTGLANAAEACGHPYGSPGFIKFMDEVLSTIRDSAYLASAQLANRHGSFPDYDPEQFLAGGFAQTLPDHVLDVIVQCGMRNSHLLSIAPTGTISLCADNVSSGIEPVFAYQLQRTIQTFEGPLDVKLEDYGTKFLEVAGRTFDQITPEEHLAVLATAYKYVDSAVSKTVNVASDTPWEDFKKLYVRAWAMGCKGLSTYQVGGLRAGVLKRAETRNPVETTCKVDPTSGRRDCE